MGDQAPGQAFAATFADQLAASGLRAVCVSPGSRSAPLAMAFARHPAIHVYVHVDERSSAFFALGLAKAADRPVAVLTTSGTAAAELHPAVTEARYAGVPLLVVTADRPPELRENGANQSIDQSRLFGSAPRWYFDPGPPEWVPGAARLWRRLAVRALAEAVGPPAGPVHLNLPFREPLTPEPGSPARPEAGAAAAGYARGPISPPPGAAARLAAAIRHAERPVVVAGSLRGGEGSSASLSALGAAGAPLLAEPTSGLRQSAVAGAVDAYDALLRDSSWASAHAPDLVLRLGATPTSKALNAWLLEHAAPTWLVDPEGCWADPDSLATEIVRADPGLLLAELADLVEPRQSEWLEAWLSASTAASRALDGALAASPLYEGHAVRELARQVPWGSTVVVGSSMAIRDVDTFWPASASGIRFLANRGASGIDGVVSTALGVAAAGGRAVALLGDLGFYHDMNGLWAARRHRLTVTFVVLDNDGGGIFSFLPPAAHQDVFEEVFATPLGLRAEDVATLYGLRFFEAGSRGALAPALAAGLGSNSASLVAVRFSRGASVEGHRAAWREVEKAVAKG